MLLNCHVLMGPNSFVNYSVGVPQPSIDSGGSSTVAAPGPRLLSEIKARSKEGWRGRKAKSVCGEAIIFHHYKFDCHFIFNLINTGTCDDCSRHTLRESRCEY